MRYRINKPTTRHIDLDRGRFWGTSIFHRKETFSFSCFLLLPTFVTRTASVPENLIAYWREWGTVPRRRMLVKYIRL